MTEYASATYPKLDFQTGDALTKDYPSGSFSHIFILYFTVYYFKDKKTLFENSTNGSTRWVFNITSCNK